MHFPNPLILGSRSSSLAVLQANIVKEKIIHAFPDQYTAKNVVIKTFKTTGDKILDQRLIDFGGKGLFTKELEQALVKDEIHCAVHSTKDMATILPDGLEIKAFLERDNPADALVSKDNLTLDQLPKGAVIGTASLRRGAQLLHYRPDFEIKLIRGNVDTRLEKLARGEYDALILAYAGLTRKNMADRASQILSLDDFLPAAAQGVVCIEAKIDGELNHIFAPLHDHKNAILVEVERLFLNQMDGSCRTPIAAHAIWVDDEVIDFRGEVCRIDGSEKFSTQDRFSKEKAIEKVKKLSETLKTNLPSDVVLYE